MVEENDGIGEVFDNHLRMALNVAAQFGERIARLRQDPARRAEARSTQETRELSARFESERAAMRAALAPVAQGEWWNHATVEDIAGARETALAWRDHDDVARTADDTIRREVRDRYGIDVDQPGGDPSAVAAALRQAEAERAQERDQREHAGEELTAAQLILASADRLDREADEWAQHEHDTGEDTTGQESSARSESHAELDAGELMYDSSQRREEFAASLDGKVDERTKFARMQADLDQGAHPREAVSTRPSKTRAATRPTPAVSRQRDQGLGR